MMQRGFWKFLCGAVVIVVVMMSGCGAEEATAELGAQEVEPTAEPVNDSTEVTLEPEAETLEDPQFVPDAPELTVSFEPFEAGEYRVDTLGTPLSFSTDERFFVQPNEYGFFVVTHVDSRQADDREVVFLRVSALSDPANIGNAWESYSDGWPASDFAGWLDNLPGEIVVSDRQETSLGGYPATRVDIELPDHSCTGRTCAWFATNFSVHIKQLWPSSTYRIWFVDQGEASPIAVIVGIAGESQRDWFDTADRLLSTVAFGEVEPNPLAVTNAGEVELPLLGGIRAELSVPKVFLFDDRGYYLTFGTDEIGPTGAVTSLVNPLTRDRDEIPSIDALVDVLREANVDVTERDPMTIGGLEGRVFDISGGVPNPILAFGDSPEGWWFDDQVGVLWAVEHPDRGLLALSAEAWGQDADANLVEQVALADEIAATLEFVELG